MRRLVPALLGAGLLAGLLAPVAPAQEVTAVPAVPWEVLRLQPIHESDDVWVRDINEHGASAGESGPTPVTWDTEGRPTALPLPEGFSSATVTALNDQGDVVGLAFHTTQASQGILWHDGAPTLLGPHLYPQDVNEHGVVVGWTMGGPDERRGWVHVPGAGQSLLPDGGAYEAQPVAVGDHGYVVGTVFATGGARAAGWYGPYAFPLLPGVPWMQEALDVTEAGHVLVRVGLPDGWASAIVTRSGQVVPLAYAGRSDSAIDLNEAGLAVGQRFVPGTDSPQGVLYAYGQALDLEALTTPEAARSVAGDLLYPTALNDDAWIVGVSWFSQLQRGWLVRPPR